MKTIAEIEKLRDEFVERINGNRREEDCPRCYRSGFDACFALMLERENVAKAALKYYAYGDIDWFEENGETAKEALAALEKLK